jgi:hypothetical protein
MNLPPHQPQKERGAEERGNDADRQLLGGNDYASHDVDPDEEDRP